MLVFQSVSYLEKLWCVFCRYSRFFYFSRVVSRTLPSHHRKEGVYLLNIEPIVIYAAILPIKMPKLLWFIQNQSIRLAIGR